MAKRVALTVLLCAMLIGILIVPVFAHSGGTDADGGHYDSSTGQYHYHCGGYPAHQHRYGVCPYEGNNSYENDEKAGGGGLLYSALVAGTAGAIVCGVIMLIKKSKNKNKDKKKQGENGQISKTNEPKQVQSVTKKQFTKLHPLDQMVRQLTPEEKSYINSQMDGANHLAGVIGNPMAYYRNKENILKMVLLNKEHDNIVNAEIVYFVYGVHDKLKRKFANKYEGDLFTNFEFIEKIHMPAVNIIVDTPPKQLSHFDYANMICELLFAQSDNEFLSIFDKYNYEYPDRIKKMLSNDIDVLAETAFYSVAVTAQMADAKYINKGRALLNFIVYYHMTILSVFIRDYEMPVDNILHFKESLKKNFIECARTLKEFETNEDAKKFFEKRFNIYNETMSIFDDVSMEALEELVDFTMKTHGLTLESEEDIVLDEYKKLLLLVGEEANPHFVRLKNAYDNMN